MEIVNLLDFLNSTSELYTLEYASCNHKLINFLDLMTEDEQLTQKIDFGLVFVAHKTLDQFLIIDGLSRVLSLSLLLHAVCECYKKTTPQNESAIKTIRRKYLLNGDKTKIRLPEEAQIVYDKIIYGERLSGKEKETSMFQLLHSMWSQIKDEKLQASNIFKMLKKIFVMMVNADRVPTRELYYALNKDKRSINQLMLIENYLKDIGIKPEWEKLRKLYNSSADLELFFKDFFITKFNFKEYRVERLYEIFVNYFETMLQYMSEDVLISKITTSAKLYRDILNVNIQDENLKQVLIKIKMHNGEDTFAYILNVYEDYIDNNINYATFLEILNTIDDYLQKRKKTPNNVSFNELINYLNAFITCK